MIDEDRLTTAPQQARTCPNCACPTLGNQCLACHYSFPDDDDVDDDDTDLFRPTQIDMGYVPEIDSIEPPWPDLPPVLDIGSDSGERP